MLTLTNPAPQQPTALRKLYTPVFLLYENNNVLKSSHTFLRFSVNIGRHEILIYGVIFGAHNG